MERSWSLLWLIDRQSIISESINYTSSSSSGHWTLSFGGVMACVYLLCYVHSLINGFIRWEKVSLRQESYYLAVSVAQLDRQAEDRCYLQLEIRRGVCLHWSYKKRKWEEIVFPAISVLQSKLDDSVFCSPPVTSRAIDFEYLLFACLLTGDK